MRRAPSLLGALALVALIGAGCSDAPSKTGGADANAGTRAKGLKFAECMRRNGVRGFPDPDGSGELTIDGIVNGSSLDPDSPAWKAAIVACKDLQPSGFTGHKRSAAQQKDGLAFARCIRDNGVEDFPDPDPDGPLVDTNRVPSAATEAGMTVLNAAMRKCGDLVAKEVTGR